MAYLQLGMGNNKTTDLVEGDKSAITLIKDGIRELDYNFLVFQKNSNWITKGKELDLTLSV